VFDIPGAPAALSHQVIKLGSSNTLNLKTEARYSLYSGGRDAALVRAAQEGVQAEASVRDQAEADLVERVSRAYYQELSAVRLQAAAADALASARSHLGVAEARVRAGVVPKLDALRARVDVSQREIVSVRAREARRMARLDLETVVGTSIDPADTLDAPAPPSASLPDSAQALASALASRPEIATLQRQIEASAQRLQAARAGHAPQIGLTGMVEYRGPNKNGDYADFTNPGLKTYDASAGVGLSLPLFDGGVVDARVAEQEAERRALEAHRRDLELAVRREVGQALSDFRVAVAVWGTNETRLSSAREALRLADAAYKEGTATGTDVRDAETALADARADEAQSLTDYWFARAELDHATGASLTGKER
jgi:outer membrane protein